ncbi:MAG: hypothetical protein HRU12_17395, partial [Phaeodactylibacter sp.]|nr:hypothetical protein [Phaeodactylibacter sp.]
MKLHFLFPFLWCLCCSLMMLGQSKIDSLQEKLAQPLPDSTRIALSDQLLRAYLSTRQYAEILIFTEAMLEEYEKKGDKYALQLAMIFRAVALNANGENEEAIRLSKIGAKFSLEIRDSLQAAKHMTNIGAFLQQQG